jgi:hypothetical protein
MSAAPLTYDQVKEVVENLEEARQFMETYHEWLMSTWYSNANRIEAHCLIPETKSLFTKITPRQRGFFERLFETFDSENLFYYPKNIPEDRLPYKSFIVEIKQAKQEAYKDLHVWFVYLPQTKEMLYYVSYKTRAIEYIA